MNRKKIIVIIILIFAIASIFLVFFQRTNVIHLSTPVETNKTAGSDLIGATNVKSFSDIYNNKSAQNKSGPRPTATVRPKPTPPPPPYPRIEINYSLQRLDNIRGISPGANNSFILVTVSIKNYGYKYFDADPRKFRLDPLEPSINISTGHMLDAVLPNNSITQGDILFITSNSQRYKSQLSYTDGGYKMIYKIVGQYSGGQGGGIASRHFLVNQSYSE